MKAALVYEYGSPDVFCIEDVPDPRPGPGQCLVDVHAAAVNPVDYKMRQGHYRVYVRYALPHIFGLDMSGVVAAVGEGVTKFSLGDEVYGSPDHKPQGCYAHATVIDASALSRKPEQLSHQEAASLPLVFQTAWQSLVDVAGLERGEHCFIQAGSGGVGTMAIQIAKFLGARVTTTCSERNVELVTSLGADRVVNYNEEAFDEVVSDVDVCLDSLGFASVRRSRAIMKPGGRIVGITLNIPGLVNKWGPVLGFLAVGASITWLRVRGALGGVRTRFHTRVPDAASLDKCLEMLEAGALKPCIDRSYALDDIAEAHRYIETGRARGKVVIDMGRG